MTPGFHGSGFMTPGADRPGSPPDRTNLPRSVLPPDIGGRSSIIRVEKPIRRRGESCQIGAEGHTELEPTARPPSLFAAVFGPAATLP